MIKRLRLKFTCISMCLITALLAVILVMICRFTWVRMETRSITILQSAADDMLPSGGNHVPGGLVRPNTQPYFIMYRGPDGKLEATSRNTY